MERIQKILAHGGIASRRAAEQLILAGRVRVNGHVVTELGAKADPRNDRVEVDGKRVVAEGLVYVVLHKPRGVVSTLDDPEGRPTVKELLKGIEGRLYPVGRLDFATSGVLLATNDGELHDGLLHPRKTVPKTYVLKVKGVMKPDDIERWRTGIKLEDGMTLPAQAKLLRHEGDKTWLELTIREGRNQQIRRMGEASGFPVMRLARVAFAEISAEGLAPGRWRHLTRDELKELKATYGVPRSLPAEPTADERPTKRTQSKAVYVRGAVKGAAGRTQRNFGAEAEPARIRGRRDVEIVDDPSENWGESPARAEPPPPPNRGGRRTSAAPATGRGRTADGGAGEDRPSQRARTPHNDRPQSGGRGRGGDARPNAAPRGEDRPQSGGRDSREERPRGSAGGRGAPRGDRPTSGGDRPPGARGAARGDRPTTGARGQRTEGAPPRGRGPSGGAKGRRR